ncbi:hypothetical protein F5Y19DRAFT_471401 [Xylariaceae sp. FL1651]|nr:hypothetical protein F5Y19DRAFT_471401 [Xylariaceae sp. FL1651]
MQFTSTILAAALFALSGTTNKHKFCNCHVGGSIDAGLSHDIYIRWGEINPNMEWVSDRASCHDYVKGGIDGKPWEDLCKKVYGGVDGEVRGNYFEK